MLEGEIATQHRLLDLFPTRLVKFKKFWQGQSCQLSVYLDSYMTTKLGWICVFPSYFRAISNRIKLLQNGRRKLPKTELCRQCPRAVPALPLSARPLERLSVGSSTLPSERAPTKAIGAASALAGSIQII